MQIKSHLAQIGLFFLCSSVHIAATDVALVARANSTSQCSSLNQRKSWHGVPFSSAKRYTTDGDRVVAYIDAEVCLMSLPPKVGTIWNAQNRWDEFHFTHIHLANFIHDSGQFLPWHRWFMRVHELALQEECNYTGAQPYWDELKDAATGYLNQSAIFNTTTGFGGNGLNGNGCLVDGPFTNVTLVMNETSNFASNCISRRFNQTKFDTGESLWAECRDIDAYEDYWPVTANGIHLLGHEAVGRIMSNGVTSPGDPLFYLHHTWLDRAWWKWQMEDEDARLDDMGGTNILRKEALWSNGLAPANRFLVDYSGDPGNTTTLNHTLYTYDLRANVTVGDVMDIRGTTICAEYVDDGGFNYTLGY